MNETFEIVEPCGGKLLNGLLGKQISVHCEDEQTNELRIE